MIDGLTDDIGTARDFLSRCQRRTQSARGVPAALTHDRAEGQAFAQLEARTALGLATCVLALVSQRNAESLIRESRPRYHICLRWQLCRRNPSRKQRRRGPYRGRVAIAASRVGCPAEARQVPSPAADNTNCGDNLMPNTLGAPS
jgi:hypothetical protein